MNELASNGKKSKGERYRISLVINEHNKKVLDEIVAQREAKGEKANVTKIINELIANAPYILSENDAEETILDKTYKMVKDMRTGLRKSEKDTVLLLDCMNTLLHYLSGIEEAVTVEDDKHFAIERSESQYASRLQGLKTRAKEKSEREI